MALAGGDIIWQKPDITQVAISRWNNHFAILQILKLYHRFFEYSKIKVRCE
jgi:hypothetical protein